MLANKVKVSVRTTHLLRNLKARTGVTPNILCRFALVLSLDEPTIPNPKDYDEDGMEFNRYTLTGEFDVMFIALLTQWLHELEIDIGNINEYFRAHLNRGVAILSPRVKDVSDFLTLVPGGVAS